MGGLSHNEIEELLGAFALDAVEVDETAEVERHLETCPRCRDEVMNHREVAALLAYQGADAPTGLWNRIAQSLEEAPSAPALVLPIGSAASTSRPRSHWSGTTRRSARAERAGWVGRAAMAVAAVIALVVGVASLVTVVVHQQHEITRIQALPNADLATNQVALAARAATTPGARSIRLVKSDKAPAATAVVLPDGTGYLVPEADGLPALTNSQTYQLWAIADGNKISIGLLGDRPLVGIFRVPAHTAALAVTAEQQPGVTSSVRPPVAFGVIDGAVVTTTSTA